MIDYLSANWPWMLVVGVMLVMHARHGCGNHHGHRHSGRRQPAEEEAGHDHPARTGSGGRPGV